MPVSPPHFYLKTSLLTKCRAAGRRQTSKNEAIATQSFKVGVIMSRWSVHHANEDENSEAGAEQKRGQNAFSPAPRFILLFPTPGLPPNLGRAGTPKGWSRGGACHTPANSK